MPAQLTTASRRPNCSLVCLRAAATSSDLVTSTGQKIALGELMEEMTAGPCRDTGHGFVFIDNFKKKLNVQSQVEVEGQEARRARCRCRS